MKTEHDWRDVLLKAALIVEEGWCQRVAMEASEVVGQPPKRCASDAIRVAGNLLSNGLITVTRAWQNPGTYVAERALRELRAHIQGGDHETSSVIVWNDSDGRTADQVAKTMRQTAKGRQ